MRPRGQKKSDENQVQNAERELDQLETGKVEFRPRRKETEKEPSKPKELWAMLNKQLREGKSRPK